MAHQHAEVGKAQTGGMQHGHGVGGCGGFEADGEEDDLAVGEFGGQAYGVHGCVDDPDVRAFGAQREEIGAAAGDVQHVPEGGEYYSGAGGDGPGPVQGLPRDDAHGAAGPCTIRMPVGSSSSMPRRTRVWVCPPQTSMICQGAVAVRCSSFSSLPGESRIAVLVEVLH